MRIKRMAQVFQELGYQPYLLAPYAPGTVAAGLNESARGTWNGINFRYCNGTASQPSNLGRTLWDRTFGFAVALVELIRIHKRAGLKYLYLYGTHGTLPHEDILPAFLSRLLGAKVIVDVNDALDEAKPDKRESGRLRYLVRVLRYYLSVAKGTRLVRDAETVIYVSEYLGEQVERIRGSRQQCFYVPVLVNQAEHEIRTRRLTRGEPLRIGYAGFFKEYEGLDFLIDVLTELSRRGIRFEAELYGATQSNLRMRVALERLIQSRGLQDRVVVRAAVGQDLLGTVLGSFDALVLPRRSSVVTIAGFSQKIGDYLITGVPMIATAVGDIPTLFANRKEIYLVPEGNVDAFADALCDVQSNPEEAIRIGLRGRTWVTRGYDIAAIARLLEPGMASAQ